MPRNLSDTISGAAIAPISHNPIHCLFKFLNWVQESLLFHPILLDITKKVLMHVIRIKLSDEVASPPKKMSFKDSAIDDAIPR